MIKDMLKALHEEFQKKTLEYTQLREEAESYYNRELSEQEGAKIAQLVTDIQTAYKEIIPVIVYIQEQKEYVDTVHTNFGEWIKALKEAGAQEIIPDNDTKDA